MHFAGGQPPAAAPAPAEEPPAETVHLSGVPDMARRPSAKSRGDWEYRILYPPRPGSKAPRERWLPEHKFSVDVYNEVLPKLREAAMVADGQPTAALLPWQSYQWVKGAVIPQTELSRLEASGRHRRRGVDRPFWQ